MRLFRQLDERFDEWSRRLDEFFEPDDLLETPDDPSDAPDERDPSSLPDERDPSGLPDSPRGSLNLRGSPRDPSNLRSSPGYRGPERPNRPGATRREDFSSSPEYVDPELARLRRKRWRAEVDRQFRICVRVALTVSGLVVGSSTSLDVLIVMTLAAVAFLARYPELI